MLIVLKQLSVLYIFLFLGWLIGKLKKDTASHSEILSVLLVNIFLPFKVFGTFANNVTTSYISKKYVLILSSLLLLLVLVFISLFIPKLLTKNGYARRVYAYSIPITNYSYLGYALIGSVFGEAILADFMLFAIPFIFFTYTAGYVMLTGGKCIVKKIITPITVSIGLGIIAGLTRLELPAFVSTALSAGSACVGPLSMILTGITLSSFAVKELLSDRSAYIFSAIRLFLIPALSYLVCRVVHLDTMLPMALIITCMPCGLNPIVFPKLVGKDCKIGARLALITHVFSLITLPFWLSLI